MYKWLSPLHIPEGRSGKFQVQHKIEKAGTEIPLVNMRTALFGRDGQRHTITYDSDVRYHYLMEKNKDGSGGCWMSDVPQEQEQADRLIKGMRGKILIGGLGLGYIATRLARRPTVESITVVEKEKDVIKLVWGYLNLRSKGQVVNGDIFDYLEHAKKKSFDYIYLDVWTSDGERTLSEYILPLRKLARPLVRSDQRIKCWNEDVMKGQMLMGLITSIQVRYKEYLNPSKQMVEIIDKWHKLEAPFWAWVMVNKPEPDIALSRAQEYVALLGSTEWLRRWRRYEKS
jgi:hypothetical protein